VTTPGAKPAEGIAGALATGCRMEKVMVVSFPPFKLFPEKSLMEVVPHTNRR
jgi:hypothetical protein